MIEYIKSDHPEINKDKHLSVAQKWLRDGESWKNKFINDEIVIDSYRSSNLRAISKHKHSNEGFEHSCAECMYYQDCEDNVDNHEDWLMQMKKKYGDCGNLLYYNGKLLGYIQYAPKNELKKLEKIFGKKFDDKTSYISCIYVEKSVSKSMKVRFVKLLLEYVLKELKNRGVKQVEISPPSIEGTISSVQFDWEFYEKLGFVSEKKDGKYVNGHINL